MQIILYYNLEIEMNIWNLNYSLDPALSLIFAKSHSFISY